MNDEITVRLREDFPILSREVYGKTLVYLDNAATTQKPRCVVEAISDEYYNVNANVHRGVHFLSQQATELHEQSRETVRQFIGADSTSEIVFTRGTTESINLLASCLRQIGTLNAKENGCGNPQKKNSCMPWEWTIYEKLWRISERNRLFTEEFAKENGFTMHWNWQNPKQ